jgi:hypothetical protein
MIFRVLAGIHKRKGRLVRSFAVWEKNITSTMADARRNVAARAHLPLGPDDFSYSYAGKRPLAIR